MCKALALNLLEEGGATEYPQYIGQVIRGGGEKVLTLIGSGKAAFS